MGAIMGGSSGPSMQTVTQKTELPQYIQDKQKGLLDISAGIAQDPYQPYSGQRIADFSQPQEAGFQGVTNNAYNPAFGNAYADASAGTRATTADAQALARQGLDLGQGLTQGAVNWALPRTSDTAGESQGLTRDTYGNAYNRTVAAGNDTLNPGDIPSWMSPYIDMALRPQLQDVQRQSEAAQKGVNTRATAAGAFGDARHGIESAENTRNFEQQRANVIGTGYQNAYDRAVAAAQNAFTSNADVGLRTGAQIGNLGYQAAGQLADTGYRGAQQFADIGLRGAGQLTDADLKAAGLIADTGYRGAAQGASIAGQQYGQQAQASKDLLDIGATQQQRQQAGLDTAYQDFINQRDYRQNQAGWFASLLAGQPMPKTVATTTPYSATAQNLGLLAALAGGAGSAYKAFSA